MIKMVKPNIILVDLKFNKITWNNNVKKIIRDVCEETPLCP